MPAVTTPAEPLMEAAKQGSRTAAANEVPVILRIARAASLGLAYVMASSTMILFNKLLMHEDRFPFPICLTTMHMSGSLALSLVLRSLVPSLFPSAPMAFKEQPPLDGIKPFASRAHLVSSALLPFAPIAACGAVTLVTGNWAYRLAPVSFLQIVNESHILFVYILMVVFGLDQFRIRNILVLSIVACFSALAVCAQITLSLPGLVLQLVCGLFGSLQLVLTNKMLIKSGKGRIDPMTMVLCVAPMMLLFLGPANIAYWDSRTYGRLVVFWPYLACNVLLAFMLQVITALTIRGLSALGCSLASMLKDLGIVATSSLILHEILTPLQLCGFAGSVAGIGLYSAMQFFPSTFESASPGHSKGK